MKIAYLTLGCKLNYAETSTYERAFRQAGFETVSAKEKADLYLINTCSVTATSDAKSRNLIRKTHRLNPEAKIIVCGCSAQLRREELSSIEGVWKIFGCKEKALIVPQCLLALGFEVEEPDLEDKVFGAYSSGERTRCFLKVQDGCDNKCHYCTVPYARGESRSIRICEAVRMAEKAASEGIREIVLTGVNTGDFGKNNGESFLDLLKALEKVEGIQRYRISSIEPNLLSDEIIDWIASGSKFQPHFHIPLQTGCDELLKAMGRHYDSAFFEKKLAYLREKLSDEVFIGIDVMVGLPGESEELFEKSLAYIKRIRPAFIHVFPYSRRPGTPAAQMEGQVGEQEKKRRVELMEKLCLELHDSFVNSQKGKKALVLFESKEKDGQMSGYSGNYIRVSREYDPDLVGKIVEVVI